MIYCIKRSANQFIKLEISILTKDFWHVKLFLGLAAPASNQDKTKEQQNTGVSISERDCYVFCNHLYRYPLSSNTISLKIDIMSIKQFSSHPISQDHWYKTLSSYSVLYV